MASTPTPTMTGMALDSIQQTSWITLPTSLDTKGSQKSSFLDVFSSANHSFSPPYDPTPPKMTLLVESVILNDNLHDEYLPLPSAISVELVSFHGPPVLLNNTQALTFLFLECMLQRLQDQDQQQHLTAPYKDPSPQLPTLDLDPGHCNYPSTSSGLNDPTPPARLDNTQAINILLLEPMLQQLPAQDQQQHLAPPPKDPSQQRTTLDLDLNPDCPGTSSGLNDAPSEPTHPSFNPTPFCLVPCTNFPPQTKFTFPSLNTPP